MNLTLRSTWAAVMLGAVLGCSGGDEPSTAPSNPASPGASSPKDKMGSPDGHMAPPSPAEASKEMLPPPKDETKAGSAGKADESPKLEPPKTDAPKGAASAVKLSDKELAAIKELPAAEQDQAIKQAVCPVSEHHLGGMGKPLKITAEGRTFYLCCDGCEDEAKSNPKAFIAKLDAQASKK
jgi:YHS domain-containing protein